MLPTWGDSFKFTINVGSSTSSKKYLIDVNGMKEILSSGINKDVTLGNGDTVTIYGLGKDDNYTITQNHETKTGYETSATRNDSEISLGEDLKLAYGSGEDENISEAQNVVFTNTKSASTPTGIVMNVAPYVLLVVVAAAGCFVFLRKRRED